MRDDDADHSHERALRELELPSGKRPGDTLSSHSFDATLMASTGALEPALDPHAALPAVRSTPPLFADSQGELDGPELALRSVLGRGGMGTVYAAAQRTLQREVAVKLLHASGDDDAALESMLTETRILASLDHPNIVPVHLLGTDERGLPALVMKRVEGVPWSALHHDDEHPLWQRLPGYRGERLTAHLTILMDVCNAVHFAHSRGVVHRDLKLDNVMIGSFGEVYLMDWGIATTLEAQRNLAPRKRGERSRSPVGTPSYMAPEMARCEPVDARTDVFLLGALLHELLTRTPRHAGDSLLSVLLAALQPEPVPYDAEVPEELAALAAAATRADPSHRPQSAAHFRDAVADYLAHRGSWTLSEAADKLLAELREPEVAPDPARFERLSTACRFGYAQALQQWPANPAARRGSGALLTLLVRRALEHGDALAAQGLLGELPEPDPALANEVRAALGAQRVQEQERERLRTLSRQLDLGVGATQRRRFFAVLGLFTVLWTGGTLTLTALGHTVFSYRSVLIFGLLFGLLVTALTLYGRRTLLGNTINRRVAGLPMFAAWCLFAHRVLGVARGNSPSHIVTEDLFLMAIIAGLAALLLLPGYAITGAILLAGAVAASYWTAHVQALFSLSGTLAVLSLSLLWRRTPTPIDSVSSPEMTKS